MTSEKKNIPRNKPKFLRAPPKNLKRQSGSREEVFEKASFGIQMWSRKRKLDAKSANIRVSNRQVRLSIIHISINPAVYIIGARVCWECRREFHEAEYNQME